MRRLLIVNNCPSHYRTFMFNKMNDKGKEYGIEVTLAFQGETEPHRPWSPDQYDMQFPYFISSGINPWKRGNHRDFTAGTFNTDILQRVMFGGYDWVLMAPFMSVGTWAMALAPSRKTKKLLWSESNFASARYLRGPVRLFKRVLQSPFDILVCPGQRAVDYVCHFNPRLAQKPVLWLPNIVDTALYDRQVRRHREHREAIRTKLGVASDEILAFGVGRMIERKGFHLLIEAVAQVEGRYKVIILGDGPLREPWLERIAELGIGDRIRLPGQADSSEVTQHLCAADWFLHTALQDPSPLVIVEATVAGLPMAVSVQTGNGPEGVEEGQNGFTYDPTDPAAMVGALKRIVTSSADDRTRMARRSARLAQERFEPDGIVDRFFQGLLEHSAGTGVSR